MQRSNGKTEPKQKCSTLWSYHIEPMEETDLEQVVRLEAECGLNSRGSEKYRSGLSDSREVLLVAINCRPLDGRRELVGLFSGMVVVDELQIDNLAVAKGWRRLGIASHLLGQGASVAYQNGALSAVLELRSANSAALSLYTRQGLAIAGKRISYYHDPPDDALIMSGPIERIITNWRPQN